MRGRDRVAVELVFQAEEKRALGTRNQLAEIEFLARLRIESLRIHQEVECVARVPSRDGFKGKIFCDQAAVGFVAEQVMDRFVDPAFHRRAVPAFRLEFRRGKPAKHTLAPVAEKSPHRNEMVADAPVNNRVRAARIVPNHPADHRAIRGRGLRAEIEPVLRELGIQLVADDPRLDPDSTGLLVDFQNFVEVQGEVHDQPASDHLAGQRWSRRARDDADPVFVREENDLAHVGLGFGKRHRQRHFLILRSIGRVELPHRPARHDFAGNPGTQPFERYCGHPRRAYWPDSPPRCARCIWRECRIRDSLRPRPRFSRGSWLFSCGG